MSNHKDQVQTPIQLRPEVLAFAQAIEQAIQNNDEDKENSWKAKTNNSLMVMLSQEFETINFAYVDSFLNQDKLKDLNKSLVDFGAIAAVLYTRAKGVLQE